MAHQLHPLGPADLPRGDITFLITIIIWMNHTELCTLNKPHMGLWSKGIHVDDE